MVLISPSRRPDIALVDDDLYCVLSETDTLGFVHRVGSVYVALAGDNLGHAVEIGQTPSWQLAVDLIERY